VTIDGNSEKSLYIQVMIFASKVKNCILEKRNGVAEIMCKQHSRLVGLKKLFLLNLVFLEIVFIYLISNFMSDSKSSNI
jgi:hypothetical protein